MASKAFVTEDGRVILDDSGDKVLPIASTLPHRFEVVDGEIVDKYDGASDLRVRQIDHEAAMEANAAAIAEWEALDEELKTKVPRPATLPALDLPEE